MSRVALSAALLALPLAAAGGQLKVASISSSSTYPADDSVRYDASQLIDGKASTSWVEGEEGSGLGSWVELDLGGEREVEALQVWGGLWYSQSYYTRANRPRELEVLFSDGSTASFPLSDEMKVQRLDLPKPVRTSTVRFKIKGIHSGSTWMDTAMSEIQVFDTTPEARISPRALTASSVAADDEDGSYQPLQVNDGLNDTMWCEGSKDGDGTGEWLEFDLGGARTVGELHLVNGIGTSLPFWMKGNRATAATLSFSDGSTEQVTLKNTMMPQTISFTSHQSSKVKMTFTTVVQGKEFNDLCISEAWFAE
ncbi:MAG: discoidin domain-containing protein [Deltaproteobacteria bacterium]|nr:discoidin domain-containing protein [Deltaproteobacteria bacterium]